MNNIELGCGLIGIGRKWGYKESVVPEEKDVMHFLKNALNLGIRFFDTAPSYGRSEERLGKFIASLSLSQRKDINVATKFGEHWDIKTESTFIDHSYTTLVHSIDQSIKRLGTINMLLVHKTTPDVLKSNDLKKAIIYAKERGIEAFGASVSDLESAMIVCNTDIYSSIQFPYHTENTTFDPIIAIAKKRNKTVIINRPFNMGESLYADIQKNPFEQKVDAYAFILERIYNGYILTGTKSFGHLQENIKAFKQAKEKHI